MGDVEQADDWLHGLWSLNEVIAATGEPLRGNLCYDDLQEDYLTRPPNSATRPKRDRLRAAVAGRTRLLEVGVNGGHSAYVALSANPDLFFYGVDVCEYGLVKGRAKFGAADVVEVVVELDLAACRLEVGDERRVLAGSVDVDDELGHSCVLGLGGFGGGDASRLAWGGWSGTESW